MTVFFVNVRKSILVMTVFQFSSKWFACGKNFGVKGEEECPSYINTGMFNVIKELDSTKYVFAGHDHLNNYSVMYDGIRLTYAMKTGDRCSQTPGQNGGTLITMGDETTVEHIYVEN